ncbi:hypothetical protein AAIH51_35610, partial [Pseudomonas aeruginosa]
MNDELATYLAELAERDPNKADALSRMAHEREQERRLGARIKSPFAIFLIQCAANLALQGRGRIARAAKRSYTQNCTDRQYFYAPTPS